jgi:4-hydroxybenzoate polyprenyltransferase
VLVYAAAVFWTVGYDTIYAIQGLEDDAVAGIKSTTRLFGHWTRPAVLAFFVLACVALIGALVRVGGGPVAYAGLAGFAAHLAWQIGRIDLKNPDCALRLFRSNRTAGWILCLGLFGDAALRF